MLAKKDSSGPSKSPASGLLQDAKVPRGGLQHCDGGRPGRLSPQHSRTERTGQNARRLHGSQFRVRESSLGSDEQLHILHRR